jgi:hypothetical protein
MLRRRTGPSQGVLDAVFGQDKKREATFMAWTADAMGGVVLQSLQLPEFFWVQDGGQVCGLSVQSAAVAARLTLRCEDSPASAGGNTGLPRNGHLPRGTLLTSFLAALA